MKYIEKLLDQHTMYQVVITSLGVWVAAALGLSLGGHLPYEPLALVVTLAVIGAVATIAHFCLQLITKAPANFGSTIITALIIFFLFTPELEVNELLGIAGATLVAVVSKYVIAYRKLHLINPAALAAVVAGLFGFGFATWWIGTPYMAPLVLLGGVLIVWKIRRVAMVVWAAVTSLIIFVVMAALGGYLETEVLMGFLFSSPLIFFLTVMVTEPLTTPAGEKEQVAYGVLIGVLSSIPFTLGPLFNSPELALVIANLVAYPLSLKSRLILTLERIVAVAQNTVELQFKPSHSFTFSPGQYLEWTLPHEKPDTRGIRRYFTIASSPTESDVKLTVRTAPEDGSTFKKHLQTMEVGQTLYATARNGEFVLPKNITDHKYLFIAGGIGVTPFRSQVKYLIDNNLATDSVLFYCNRHEEDIAYADVFKAAESIGLRTINVLSKPGEGWRGESGFIDNEMLMRHVSDVAERKIFISGPPAMVGAYTTLLKKAGVSAKHIKTDYFPGLA